MRSRFSSLQNCGFLFVPRPSLGMRPAVTWFLFLLSNRICSFALNIWIYKPTTTNNFEQPTSICRANSRCPSLNRNHTLQLWTLVTDEGSRPIQLPSVTRQCNMTLRHFDFETTFGDIPTNFDPNFLSKERDFSQRIRKKTSTRKGIHQSKLSWPREIYRDRNIFFHRERHRELCGLFAERSWRKRRKRKRGKKKDARFNLCLPFRNLYYFYSF